MVSEENLINLPHPEKHTQQNGARSAEDPVPAEGPGEAGTVHACAIDLCQMVAVPMVDKAKSSVADPGSGAFLIQ